MIEMAVKNVPKEKIPTFNTYPQEWLGRSRSCTDHRFDSAIVVLFALLWSEGHVRVFVFGGNNDRFSLGCVHSELKSPKVNRNSCSINFCMRTPMHWRFG